MSARDLEGESAASLAQRLFDRMDRWRHLPNYQLERRADLLFSLYLPEALERRLGSPISRELVPEFPVRIGTIRPDVPINKSYKIDYLAISTDGTKAILVELKTDGASRRVKQDEYLSASREVGLKALLEGVLEIFRATTAKRKYFCLLLDLERMGLLRIPPEMKELMMRPILQGANEASRGIAVASKASECLVVYVQPVGSGAEVISFEDFASVVRGHTDPFSQRFAQSLLGWVDVQAGLCPHPGPKRQLQSVSNRRTVF